MISFFIEKSCNPLLASMQTKRTLPVIYIWQAWVKLLKNSQKAIDNTILSLAVKYRHGYEYHTDNSQKLSKYKDYLTRNLATKHSTAKHGQKNQ